MTGHPRSIIKMVKLRDDNTIMTLGIGDYSLCIWTIDSRPAVEKFKAGGTGLRPFCTLIPGGHKGWLFKEMQDIFIYMQMISKTGQTPDEQMVTDYLCMAEVGDFLRAIGLFITNFEETVILKELTKNRPGDSPYLQVSFETLVKIYVNHKPAFGTSIKDIENAFMRCARLRYANESDECVLRKYPKPRAMLLDRDDMLNVLTTRGQHMSRLELEQCLSILCSKDDDDNELYNQDSKGSLLAEVPEMFSMKDFMENVLGLKVEPNEKEENRYQSMNMGDPSQAYYQLKNNL